jgi:hypothetical protein
MDMFAMKSAMWHTRELAVAAEKRATEMKRNAEAMAAVAARLRVEADEAAARVAQMMPPRAKYARRAKTQATNQEILSAIAAGL